MARLGDICIQITDGSHNPPMGVEQSNYLMLSSKNIDDDHITFNDPRYLSQEDFEAENKRTNIKPNDLLITIVGTIGRVAIVPNSLTEFCVQRSVAVLKPKPEMVYNRFLMYYLQNMRPYLEQESRGVAQKGIYLKQLSNLSIILPPLDEQRKIAAVLDKVSDLIAKRRQQLDKLDELIKARFVEMFGEPIYNSKELPTEQGINFFKLSNGKFLSESKRFSSGIPAYGGNGVSWYTDDSMINNNTLVVGRVGFQSGNVRFVEGPLWVTDNAMYVSDYDTQKYDLLFLCVLMEHINFTRFQDAGDLKKITQKPFMNMEYIRPSLQEQHKYIFFVKQTEKIKNTINKSLEKLETLKKALMQEYFG